MIGRLLRKLIWSHRFRYPPDINIERHVELQNCILHGPVHVGYRSYANDSMLRKHTNIGRYCSIGRRVTIGAAKHGLSRVTTHTVSYDPACGIINPPHRELPRGTIIGNDVWIGDNVVILDGVVIGHGAVIGAGAVVTKDIAPYTIAAGVPARPLRLRFGPTTIAALLDLAWWIYGDDILQGIDLDRIEIAIPVMRERAKNLKVLSAHYVDANSTLPR